MRWVGALPKERSREAATTARRALTVSEDLRRPVEGHRAWTREWGLWGCQSTQGRSGRPRGHLYL